MKPRFELGHIVATPGAIDAMKYAEVLPLKLLARHANGDWGDLDEEDKKETELSVEQGFRILPSYKLHTDVKIWIITGADRSATMLLLPEDS